VVVGGDVVVVGGAPEVGDEGALRQHLPLLVKRCPSSSMGVV
jgi:hypothetical protein